MQATYEPTCKPRFYKLNPHQHVLLTSCMSSEMNGEQGAINVIPPKPNRKLPADFDSKTYS